MADIHIEREHTLGFDKARKIAFQWAEQIEKELDLTCTYEEGTRQDVLSFSRSGVSGTLAVTAVRFELEAKLGFLLGIFKERIEGEIVKNLDTLLAEAPTSAEVVKTVKVKKLAKANKLDKVDKVDKVAKIAKKTVPTKA